MNKHLKQDIILNKNNQYIINNNILIYETLYKNYPILLNQNKESRILLSNHILPYYKDLEEILSKNKLISFYESFINTSIALEIIKKLINQNNNLSPKRLNIFNKKINDSFINKEFPKINNLNDLYQYLEGTIHIYFYLINIYKNHNNYSLFYLKKDTIFDFQKNIPIINLDINTFIPTIKELINNNSYFSILNIIPDNTSPNYHIALNNIMNKTNTNNIVFKVISNKYNIEYYDNIQKYNNKTKIKSLHN